MLGEWFDGIEHGKGVSVYTNGDKYAGDWAHGKETGEIYIV
jgi:hypothetical protein